MHVYIHDFFYPVDRWSSKFMPGVIHTLLYRERCVQFLRKYKISAFLNVFFRKFIIKMT